MKDDNNIEPDLDDIFEVRSANEWIGSAKSEPVPKMLFGDLWLTGELCLMFGDTGSGKSLLAAQIAESIARGTAIAPFEMTAPPQPVAYIDLELSEKQFEMRYAADHDASSGEHLSDHYVFSRDFHRVALKSDARSDLNVAALIEPIVRRTGAKVLILDNISYLQKTTYGAGNAPELMAELKRLTKKLGLSILVLANAPKRGTSRPLSLSDLRALRSLAKYADNVLAIGQNADDAAGRYVKHIMPRSTELVYGSSHVATFSITKIGGNFLGFEPQGFTHESALLRVKKEGGDWEFISHIQQLHELGWSIRKIAARFEISKSKAHRYLHMAAVNTHLEEASRAREAAAEPCEVCSPAPREQAAREFNGGSASPGPADAAANPNYFPGREEYEAARKNPKLLKAYEEINDETRAGYLIEAATAAARRHYQKTGTTPALDEMIAKLIERSQPPTPQREPQSEPVPYDEANPRTWVARLKPAFDGYGKEIFIELENDRARLVWYKFNNLNRLMRSERNSLGINVEAVTSPIRPVYKKIGSGLAEAA